MRVVPLACVCAGALGRIPGGGVGKLTIVPTMDVIPLGHV